MPGMTAYEGRLPGRRIEDIPYTGLIERLSQISAIAHLTEEMDEHLERTDLLNFIAQIGELVSQAVVFAGATQEEAMTSFKTVLNGTSLGPTGTDA